MKIKKFLRNQLQAGNFRLTIHAVSRMDLRYVSEADIRNCGKTAKSVIFQEKNNTWKLTGKDLDDLDDFDLTVVCSIENKVLIITVYN